MSIIKVRTGQSRGGGGEKELYLWYSVKIGIK
jgi:hypothetical protein